MPQVNSQYMMPVYTNDFGQTIDNVFFHISNQANPAVFNSLDYTLRTSSPCSNATSGFKTRRIEVTYSDGTKIQYPVANRGLIQSAFAELMAVGFISATGALTAVCAKLIGEEYRFVLKKTIGASLPYDSVNKHIVVNPSGKKTSQAYDYNSDILTTAIGLKASIPTHSSEETYDLSLDQVRCLINPVVGLKSPCSGAGLGIKPRRLTLVHVSSIVTNGVTKYGLVERSIPISSKDGAVAVTCAVDVAPHSLCLRYTGETIARLDNLL